MKAKNRYPLKTQKINKFNHEVPVYPSVQLFFHKTFEKKERNYEEECNI